MATYFSETGNNTPQYFDPLGTDTGVNSGQAQRSGIYNTMQSQTGAINTGTRNYVSALNSAASDPALAQSKQYEQDILGGKYLNGSPALDNSMAQMRAAASRAVADQNAKTASGFAQNGMSFGTGNQEAQQAGTALQTSQANQTEADARLKNYEAERGYMEAAPSAIQSIDKDTTGYLSAVPGAYLAPLTSEAQIVAGLSGGGTVATPSTYQTSSGVQQTLGNTW